MAGLIPLGKFLIADLIPAKVGGAAYMYV